MCEATAYLIYDGDEPRLNVSHIPMKYFGILQKCLHEPS